MNTRTPDHQLTLGFREKKQIDPTPLLRFLQHRDWALATEIPCHNDRRLRTLANASNGQIISSNKGYKLTKYATIEEIQHCTNRLRHQAEEMTRRAMQIARVYHRGNQRIL